MAKKERIRYIKPPKMQKFQRYQVTDRISGYTWYTNSPRKLKWTY